jgi:hypothetical protein
MKSNLRNANSPTYENEVHVFGLSGYPTVSFQIVGTFTSGSYTPQVSNDGEAWGDISAISLDGTAAATVSAVGMYRCDVSGFQIWRLNPSSVEGSHAITSFAGTEPMPQAMTAP